MPLYFHDPLDPPGEWGLWHITESETELRTQTSLHPSEQEQIAQIKGEERRREYLAARLLLHRMSGRSKRAELVKDDDGKPRITDSAFHVSISHTVGYSAAIAHPRACGIDVQRMVPRIRRLAHKFVNAREQQQLREADELVQLHLLWAAKEAMYKAYGRRQVDFREHLRVDLDGGSARLTKDDTVMEFGLWQRVYEGFVLVGVVEGGVPPR